MCTRDRPGDVVIDSRTLVVMAKRKGEPTREQLEQLMARVLEAGYPREPGYMTVSDPWGEHPVVKGVPCSAPDCTRNSTHWLEVDDKPVCEEHYEAQGDGA